MVLTRIQKYLREQGMSATAFGLAVANDPRLVHDLRKGRAPGPSMLKRIDAFLRAGR